MAVRRSLCPLSPTFGSAFGEDSTVGERAGVWGLWRAVWPPHPIPLLRTTSISLAKSLAVERGQAGVPPIDECTHSRMPAIREVTHRFPLGADGAVGTRVYDSREWRDSCIFSTGVQSFASISLLIFLSLFFCPHPTVAFTQPSRKTEK